MTVPPQEDAERSPFKSVAANGVTFVVGVEATNKINVGVQLKLDGDVVQRVALRGYLSDDANGDSVVATAPSGAVVIGTDGLMIDVVAKKAWLLTSEADGDIDIDITEAGVDTFYVVIVLPDGTLAVSPAITFA